jgi:hypothetical protein
VEIVEDLGLGMQNHGYIIERYPRFSEYSVRVAPHVSESRQEWVHVTLEPESRTSDGTAANRPPSASVLRI